MIRNGEVYQGMHEPMITPEQFDKTQVLLGRKGKPRPKKHEFAFTGLIRCKKCGGFITAEERYNRYGYQYIYYHCTRRKKTNPMHTTEHAYSQNKRSIDNLVQMRLRELISDEEYIKQKRALLKEQTMLKKRIKKSRGNLGWIDPASQTVPLP